MASYTETTKTAEYVAVSSVETPQNTDLKRLPGPMMVDASPTLKDVNGVSCSKGRKKKEEKKKRCLFMCCSNMQFENEEEKEKTLTFLKGNEESKRAMVMCFSNFQVGPNDKIGPKKIDAK